jgi:hypothetical protein
MIFTRALDCAHMRLYCLVCNRKFGIRNITSCPECTQWRQVCQTCGNLEECPTLQGCILKDAPIVPEVDRDANFIFRLRDSSGSS